MTVDPNKTVVAAGGESPPSDPPADKGGSRKLTAEDKEALDRTHEERRKQAEKERDEARAEASAERQRRQQLEQTSLRPQGADPLASPLAALRAAAVMGDEQAQLQLEIAAAAANADLNNRVMEKMMLGGVKPDEWHAVKNLLIQNPSLDVTEARKRARGPGAERLEAEAEELRTKNAELQKRLEQEQNRVRVPNMSLTPAAPPRDAATIPRAEANRILEAGGDEARQLKARLNSAKGSEGHLEIG